MQFTLNRRLNYTFSKDIFGPCKEARQGFTHPPISSQVPFDYVQKIEEIERPWHFICSELL